MEDHGRRIQFILVNINKVINEDCEKSGLRIEHLVEIDAFVYAAWFRGLARETNSYRFIVTNRTLLWLKICVKNPDVSAKTSAFVRGK